jgi:hypothetical protein
VPGRFVGDAARSLLGVRFTCSAGSISGLVVLRHYGLQGILVTSACTGLDGLDGSFVRCTDGGGCHIPMRARSA